MAGKGSAHRQCAGWRWGRVANRCGTDPPPGTSPSSPTPQTRRGRSRCSARPSDAGACRTGNVQLVAGPAVVTGAAVGVALTGVPFKAAHAATTAGCTSNASTLATFSAFGPKLAMTGWATGINAPSTLQATARASVIRACCAGVRLLQAPRQRGEASHCQLQSMEWLRLRVTEARSSRWDRRRAGRRNVPPPCGGHDPASLRERSLRPAPTL